MSTVSTEGETHSHNRENQLSFTTQHRHEIVRKMRTVRISSLPVVTAIHQQQNQLQQSTFQCSIHELLRHRYRQHAVIVHPAFRSRHHTSRSTIISNDNPQSLVSSQKPSPRCYHHMRLRRILTDRAAIMIHHHWTTVLCKQHSSVSAIDGCKNGEKPPKWTAAMEKELAILEKRFFRLELEPHGKTRGIEVARQMIVEEKIEKRATKPMANIYLNNWIYRYYALKLGYDKLTDIPGEVLANDMIREGTTIRFWKYKNPKTILKEMFRYPDRPTVMQQRYIDKDRKAESRKGTVQVNALTPEEEERERRMWDPNLFKPKLYGKKALAVKEKKLRKKHKF